MLILFFQECLTELPDTKTNKEDLSNTIKLKQDVFVGRSEILLIFYLRKSCSKFVHTSLHSYTSP